MHYLVIDMQQLYTRLRLASGRHTVDLDRWLNDHGFIQASDGWYGTEDSLNSLSFTEIVFSEWRHPSNIGPAVRQAALTDAAA